MRRLAVVGLFALALLASGYALGGDHPGDGFGRLHKALLSRAVVDTSVASATTAPTAGAVLRNQHGEEVGVGVSGPPPATRPGEGQGPSDTMKMHIMRNGQLWTVEVPVSRVDGTVTVTGRAMEAMNSQLPQMRRCDDRITAGCWPFAGEPPGNPNIPDSAHP